MGPLLQTKHVLPMLAERGVPAQRESLAAMSDALGLRTRMERGTWSARRWTPEQVEMIALAFRLRRGWNLDISDLKTLIDRGDDVVTELTAEYQATLASFTTVGQAVLATEDEGLVPAPGVDRPDLAAEARRGAA